MVRIYRDFDLTDFWVDSDHANTDYFDEPPDPSTIAAVQKQLGYTLPAAYLELCRQHNGGVLKKTCIRSPSPTSWAEDHVAITGLYSIGSRGRYSLCGERGSRFWVDAWGYPPIGIYFADCPSAGHDMICLDYRTCGPDGEPSVVHVDQEWRYRITLLADDFETFIRSLDFASAFDV
ncbi:SMI1/KNR4 family protein [Bradyrhizobium sp. HKCCYLS2038]|uniref:SMI1/KNR4 family protein n=1 Tax=unclassified Bradyrhizobium TaxID=2631580 RepID=UPI003EC02774